MAKHKKKLNQGTVVWLTVFGLVDLVLIVRALLQRTDVALLNPKGLIAQEQLNLMIFSAIVMLVIAIPVLALFYFVAWKYRESNDKATYDARMKHGKLFVFNLWAIPTVFMLVLAVVMWSATHRLEPQKPIAIGAKPLTIQVVAMRWKWLFIYPEQNIATVNFVQVPVGMPVEFELTADEAPMSSFWIPHWGGQLYAMTGHMNRLNLIADTPGDYPGSSAEINGAGFAGMKFVAHASSKENFDQWVQGVQTSSDTLDTIGYETLLKPSENHPTTFYAKAETGLYDEVLMKYVGSHDRHPANYEAAH